MTHRWYSPQLSLEIVSRLYYKAKAVGISMTTLVNRIVGQAPDEDNAIEIRPCARAPRRGLFGTTDVRPHFA